MTEGNLILWNSRFIGRETRSSTAKSSIKWTINSPENKSNAVGKDKTFFRYYTDGFEKGKE
jgi:hypothetical protein